MNDATTTLQPTNVKVRSRRTCGGVWTHGTLAGHRFEALVFPEHAESAAFELEQSRISKLWLQRTADRVTVASFDRGWDLTPATPEAAELVALLTAGLAEIVFVN